MSTAVVILAVILAAAVWVGSLCFRPFGPCPTCHGTGHVIRARGRRAKTCPRCKGRRRIQRPGSRTVHRLARAVRKGQAAAARHQQEED
jgi:DnaJ-class molecular chaperone